MFQNLTKETLALYCNVYDKLDTGYPVGIYVCDVSWNREHYKLGPFLRIVLLFILTYSKRINLAEVLDVENVGMQS